MNLCVPRPTSKLRDSGIVDVCDHLCTRDSTGERHTEVVAILVSCVHFLGHECRAHSTVGQHPPGLKYQCREAKHVIPRYSRRVLRSPRDFYSTMLSEVPRSLLEVFGWSVPQPEPFPQATPSWASYARKNSGEASGQLNRPEHVLSPPGTLVGWRP